MTFSVQKKNGMAHIFHPTDFSPPSMAAFGHALRLAVDLGTDLTIMHIDPDHADTDFEEFPRVRKTLTRWGVLPREGTKGQLIQLGLCVRKIKAASKDPMLSVVQCLQHSPADIVVVASHERDPLSDWLKNPVAADISRNSRITTLFVPELSKGFVSLEDGSCRLQRILIPIDHQPSPQSAVEAVCMLAAGLKAREVSFHLLYVGDPLHAPPLRLPGIPGWQWQWIFSSGVVVDEILAVMEKNDYHLVAMSTQWHHGFLDALRGSTTERVVRRAHTPVLAVPVHDSPEPLD